MLKVVTFMKQVARICISSRKGIRYIQADKSRMNGILYTIFAVYLQLRV